MAKIVNGSLVLDPDDRIDFIDIQGTTHSVYWDDILDRFIAAGKMHASQFIGATNAVTAPRNPQPSDDSYVVPTIWINSTTTASFLLVNQSPGNAIWRNLEVGTGGETGSDRRITINDGVWPTDVDPFDMWITIDPS